MKILLKGGIFLQYYIMRMCKHTAKLEEFYSENLYLHHRASAVNIFLGLPDPIRIHPSLLQRPPTPTSNDLSGEWWEEVLEGVLVVSCLLSESDPDCPSSALS